MNTSTLENLEKKTKELLEKKGQQHRFAEIGTIAKKAQIDHLDNDALLGAFLEIASKIDKNCSHWKQIAKTFIDDSQDASVTLIISFNSTPDEEVISRLKNMSFKWSSFRKQFYGYGNLELVKQALSGSDFNIEAE